MMDSIFPPLFRDRPGTFNGLEIIEDSSLVDTHEDWSEVRSPGRARRRRAKHPQRIKVTYTPKTTAYVMGNTAFMHPAMARALRDLVPSARPHGIV